MQTSHIKEQIVAQILLYQRKYFSWSLSIEWEIQTWSLLCNLGGSFLILVG